MAARRKVDEGVLARARELLSEDGASQRSVAAELGVSQSGLSRALRRTEDQRHEQADRDPDVEITGRDEAAFYGLELKDLADAETMLRRRGFDPAEWEVTKASMTEWGRDPETGAPYQRLKVDVRRRLSLLGLLPAPAPTLRPLPQLPEPDPTEPQVGVVFSDPHAPYHDQGMHEAVLAFLQDVPRRITPLHFGLLLGDTVDLPRPSRHRRNPAFDASPQESVDAGTRLLEDYTLAAELRWLKLLGNHDVRLRNFLLESASPELASLRPGRLRSQPEGDLSPALAISRLLHTDALGIECVEPAGEYGDELIYVSPKLAFIHGEKTGSNPGASELKAYGHSIGFGHTHRKSTTFRTTWDGPEATPEVGPFLAGAGTARPQPMATTHLAFEVGCMCRIEGGLGYVRRPDWQNGFGVVTVWPDGTFNLEHAVYTAGTLFWRGERWRP